MTDKRETMNKTTARELEVVRRVALSVEHQEIGKGLAAYRITQKTVFTTEIDWKQGGLLCEDCDDRQGLATVEDLGRLVSGELELRDMPKYPVLQRDEFSSIVIAVGPSFLAYAQEFGFSGDPSRRDDEGLYDEINRWVQTPLSHLEDGKEIHFIEFFSAAHQLFDLEGLPLPVCLGFDYINGGVHNERFKLKKLVKLLSEREDVRLAPHGGERERSWGDTDKDNKFIGHIPGYNADKGRDRCVQFYWHPGVEDYRRAFARAAQFRKESGKDDGPGSYDLRRAAMETLGLDKALKKGERI